MFKDCNDGYKSRVSLQLKECVGVFYCHRKIDLVCVLGIRRLLSHSECSNCRAEIEQDQTSPHLMDNIIKSSAMEI